jgi:trehalose/maltose hydrolase-like predicted phosphorylase
VGDIQGGTTAEGIHLGAMAGTVDVVQRCFTGIEMRGDVLWLNPSLPDTLNLLKCRLRYRGHWLCLEFRRERVTVRFEQGTFQGAKIGFDGQIFTMQQGETREFPMRSN